MSENTVAEVIVENDDGAIYAQAEEIDPVEMSPNLRVDTFDIEVDDRNGFPEDGEGLVHSERRPVGPVAGDRLHHVRHGHDPDLWGLRLAGEGVGVAGAVKPLMVIQSHLDHRPWEVGDFPGRTFVSPFRYLQFF